MDRWVGRVALVTGASVGCGAAVSQALVKHGMKVVACARRVELIQAIEKDIKGASGQLIPYQCDLSKENEVANMLDHIQRQYGGVDVCVNNVGFTSNLSLLDDNVSSWRNMMDVNVISAAQMTQLSIKNMRERNVDDGYIIHINGTSGHSVIPWSYLHFCGVTKFALRALIEGFRQELREIKSPIRIAEISPSVISTEFFKSALKFTDEEDRDFYDKTPHLKTSDIVDTIEYMLSRPPHVEVGDVIIRNKDSIH